MRVARVLNQEKCNRNCFLFFFCHQRVTSCCRIGTRPQKKEILVPFRVLFKISDDPLRAVIFIREFLLLGSVTPTDYNDEHTKVASLQLSVCSVV